MQKDEKEPLLSKDSAEDETKYGICDSITTISKLAIMPIIGMIFHPMY